MMKRFMRSLNTLLAAAALCLAPTVAHAENAGHDIEEQDPHLTGVSMRYTPAEDARQHEGFTTRSWQARPVLFTVNTGDAGTYHAYCLELTVQPDRTSPTVTSSWGDFKGENAFKTDESVRRKVAWIIHNSYPTSSLEDVARAAGIRELAVSQAITATQSAIWHLTDGVDPDFTALASEDTHGVDSQAIAAVYRYLISPENVGIVQEELHTGVTLNVPDRRDFAGERLGPFNVETGYPFVAVTVPAGFTVENEAGEVVDASHVPAREAFYMRTGDVRDAGDAEIGVSIDTARFHGSLITPMASPERHGQTLVMVREEKMRMTDTATISWLGHADMCVDNDGVPVRDPKTGRIIERNSSACVVTPVPPATEATPIVNPQPPAVQPARTEPETPKLAQTGPELYVLSGIALAIIASGIGFLIWEKRKFRSL